MGRLRHQLTAAAALGAAAVIALAGCTSSGSGTTGVSTPAASATGTPTPATTTGSASAPSSTAATASGSPATSRSSSPSGNGSGSSGGVHQRLSDVRVADLTFVGTQGWLLGTATCLNGSGSGCTAIEHSTDSGRTWTSMPSPAGVHVAVPAQDGVSAACVRPCVNGIRFASPTVGYLFGPGADGALYLTTDAGASWRSLPGSADGLEAAGGTALRVVDGGNCPPGCLYSVQVSPVGTMTSRRVSLPGRGNEADGVEFGRSGPHAFVLSLGHVAGGGDTATSVLWTSGNGGGTWTNRGEPCPQRGSEYDSSALSVGPDGSAALLCRQRSGQHQFVATVTSGGHVDAAPANSLGSAEVTALGDVSAGTVVISSDQTYRSTDGGAHLSRLSANGGSGPGQLSWIAFSSSTVGHAISLDRTTLWLTTDGGRTWTSTIPH